jgi:glycosyltransferase involved in cell wall biosynthesis
MWLPHTLAARRVARQFGKPVISSVHGMLEKWELANKGLKKKVYSWLFERASLAQSACLRALTAQEAEDYRRYGLRNPIAIVPNGVCPPTRRSTVGLLARFPELQGKRVVLFLGRVHQKKGILNLIEAWREVVQSDDHAHLLVAGGDYEGTLEKCKAAVSRLGLSGAVTFAGTLSGELKEAALSAAVCFCLPSYSEGLSVATLEALSIGLPVVITPACNLEQVAAVGAGLLTRNNPPELAAALSRVLALDIGLWQEMSARASKLAREQFSWNEIGSNMSAVYDWVLGGSKPACVVD